jgi:hypothetical protein
VENEVLTHIFSTPLFTQSFLASIIDKLNKTGYVEIDNYYKHYQPYERGLLLNGFQYPQLRSLLLKSQPDEAAFIDTLKRINELPINEDLLSRITFEMGSAIVSWLLYCNKQRYSRVIRDELVKWVSNNISGTIYTNQKYLLKEDVAYKIVDSLESYIHIILELEPKHQVFFRGQESLNYCMQPSISRSENLCKNEAKLYQELILRCPNDFSNCKSHLDYLVEMQHYGLPTRLLDITSNPLVALFFSSLGKADSGSGEVIIFDIPNEILKYERSDTVTILSCLPLFSYKEQKILLSHSFDKDLDAFNRNETVLRLLHEIKIDKPAFTNRIIPSDIRKNLVVTPSLKNSRIVKQAGAFIICGLVNGSETDNRPLESLRYRTPEDQRLLLIIERKAIIQGELRTLNINSATLFPEIDDVASYLRNSWL